jgi:hypothetical protein
MQGIPQIIVIALYAMSVGSTLAEVADGKRTGKDMLNRILGTAVMIGLLWWGGFFS